MRRPVLPALTMAMVMAAIATPLVRGQPASPGGRSLAGMVYDEARHEVVLFGGYGPAAAGGGLVYPNDLWAWNGVAWRRIDARAAERPSGRAVPQMVYDGARKRVVVFGGRIDRGRDSQILDDLWEWDGARWHRLESSATPRLLHAATAYDPVRQRVIIYGGIGDGGFSRSIREWNGHRWLVRDTAGPMGVIASAAIVNRRGELEIMTTPPSGDNDPVPDSSTTWAWNGSSWRRAERGPPFANLQPTATSPDGTLYFFQVAERWLRGAVMHVRWSDGVWSSFPAALRPELYGAAAAFDAARQRLVVYGGGRPDGPMPAETWELDGRKWTKR